MSKHQLPKINNFEIFEYFVCDLFNEIEKTHTFKKFGRSGDKQKGIDIFSVEKDVAIQCKKKDSTRKDIEVRKELINGIEKDVTLILEEKLKINISKLYILSTYKDDPHVDEFCEELKKRLNTNFEIIYWGWQTIEEKACDFKKILEKYWKNFIISSDSSEKTFKTNLDLRKKIRVDFADWINYSLERRKKSSKVIIRNFEDNQYPLNEPDENGRYSWFSAEIYNLCHNGMNFINGITYIYLFLDNSWDFQNSEDLEAERIKVWEIGIINFSEIEDYDILGDEHHNCPIIFCKFRYKGTPFANYYYVNIDKSYEHYELDKKR